MMVTGIACCDCCSAPREVNVSDVEVSDLLSRSVTTKENNVNTKMRTWTNRVPSKVVFHSWHPDTGTTLHDERPPGAHERERYEGA